VSSLFTELIEDTEFINRVRSFTHKEHDWIWTGPYIKGLPHLSYKNTPIHIRNLYYYCYTGVVDRRTIRMMCNTQCVNPFHMNKGPSGPYANNGMPNNVAYLGGSNYKLEKNQVIAIKDMYNNKGIAQADIAEAYHISPSQVSNIIRGKCWFGSVRGPIEYKTIFEL